MNADQIAYWNSAAGERWLRFQHRMDALFEPITTAALARAAARGGEHVIDIGCGCGETLLHLARAVGERGSVLGVDVSQPMLGLAAERVAAEDLRNVRVALADAAAYAFEPRADLVFSRFGVMFFDQPSLAFANLGRALRPGGRLSFVCWRSRDDNSWASLPLHAALPHLPPLEPVDPSAPGPFAFAEPERLRTILWDAGFAQVSLDRFDVKVNIGGELPSAIDLSTQMGLLGRLFATVDAATQHRIRDAVARALEPHTTPQGVMLDASVWLVAAIKRTPGGAEATTVGPAPT